MTRTLILLALGLICLVAGESIVSLKLNKAEGQMYALSTGNRLYELDNVAVAQNNKHTLNITIPPTITSTHIKKINGVKSVFQTLSDPTYGTQIARFDLPFGNKRVLNPAAIIPDAYGYSGVPTVFVDTELIAIIISNGNKLNLFNLVTENKTDDIFIFHGTKLGATAVLYNQKTHTAVVFWYQFLQGSRTYRMFVNEYSVINHEFVEINTTYDYNDDFRNSRANYAAFDSYNNYYWILDDISNRFVKFDASNMSVYSFISLGAVSFEIGIPSVAYNFKSQLAYVTSDADTGYYLQEVDLAHGTIRRAATINTGGYSAATVELDAQEGNLYVGLIDPVDAGKLSVVDLGNLSQELITLTH